MRKNKILLSTILILLMVVQPILPLISYAHTDEEGNHFPDIELTLSEDKTKINITASDTEDKIVALKWVKTDTEIDKDYFVDETDKNITSFDIESSSTISDKYIEVDGSGYYSVYAENERGNGFISTHKVTLSEDLPTISLSKDGDEKLHLNITVTSKHELTTLKIAKESTQGEEINFSTINNTITFTKSTSEDNTYTAEYTATEEGLYVVYAENTKGSKSKEIYLGTIFAYTETKDTNGNLTFTITDAMWNITEVKIAKLSDLSDTSEVEEKGVSQTITEGTTVSCECTNLENGKYVIFAKDSYGNKLTKTTTITLHSDDTPSVVLTTSDDNSKINIVATDTYYNITELKWVKTDSAVTKDYFDDTTGKDITSFNIESSKTIENKYIEINGSGYYSVYAKNELGNSYVYNLQIVIPTDAPEITLTRDSDNRSNLNISVNSKDELTTLKIAKESTIGEEIDFSKITDTVAFTKSTDTENTYTAEYTATEKGRYVVYAETKNGNKSTNRIYLGASPITATISDINENNKVKLTIEDELYDIEEIKVTKMPDNTNTITSDYFKENGTALEFTKGKTVTYDYTVLENGNYIFYIKDTAGQIALKQSGELTVNTTYKLGDINGDGQIDEIDLGKLIRYLTNSTKWNLTEDEQKRADINKDGTIDEIDLGILIRHLTANSNSDLAKKHPTWLLE